MLIPILEMQRFIDCCMNNLSLWQTRKAELEEAVAKAAEETEDNPKPLTASTVAALLEQRTTPRYDDYRNTFPLTLKVKHRVSIQALRPASSTLITTNSTIGSGSSSQQHTQSGGSSSVGRRLRKGSDSNSSTHSVETSYSSASAFSGGASSEGMGDIYDSSGSRSTYVTTNSSPQSPRSELGAFRFDSSAASGSGSCIRSSGSNSKKNGRVKRPPAPSTVSGASEYYDCMSVLGGGVDAGSNTGDDASSSFMDEDVHERYENRRYAPFRAAAAKASLGLRTKLSTGWTKRNSLGSLPLLGMAPLSEASGTPGDTLPPVLPPLNNALPV